MTRPVRTAARTHLLVILPLALALGACSTTPALSVTASPTSIGGDGQSPITVTAKVTSGGAPATDGTPVHFVATDGVFTIDGTPTANPLVVDVNSQSGAATAVLTVPRRGRGNITITASSSFSGSSVSQAVTVALTPAGSLATSLQFSCASQNVGGLVPELANPIHVLCTANAVDANGAVIPNASIEPYAEAGELSWITDNTSGKQLLVYTINPGATPPLDVDPFGPDGHARSLCPNICSNDPTTCDAEPCWVGNNGITHNPRDGVATLMVAVPGVPGFFDQNANGEPFVDSNDNNVHDTGEFFIDVNGNGRYDDNSGGQQQNPRMVWRALRIIWSGEADVSNSTHGSHVTGTPSGAKLNNLVVRLNDINFNKLAVDSADGSDGFALAAACNPDGSLTGNVFNAVPKLDPHNPGILFDPPTGNISGPGLPSTYRQETDTQLQSFGSPQISGNTGISQCTVSATVTRTFDPGAGTLFNSQGSLANETVSNTFSFAAPTDGGS